MILNYLAGSPSVRSTQSGMVLVVGLIMVLLLTIIGLSAIRGSVLQENMAGNMRDRNIAFQAAESALREGENVVAPAVKVLPSFVDCSQDVEDEEQAYGLCEDLTMNVTKSVSFWGKEKWASRSVKTSLDFEYISDVPRYIVEQVSINMGDCAKEEASAIDLQGMATTGDCTPYRITAQGFGVADTTEVVLQSTYKRPFN